jgi:hypothetical protein
MIEQDIKQALDGVRQMQALVLNRQHFAGFSGIARMAGGAAALLTALILRYAVPADPRLHLVGWGALLAVGLAVNFTALFYWLFKNRRRARLGELWPVLEMVPALSVGAILSCALIRIGQFNLLFGVWMALYGVSHMAYRRSLPFLVYCGGLAYVLAGSFCLLWPGLSFTDPRPMGFVFGLGELFGGYMLVKGRDKPEGGET